MLAWCAALMAALAAPSLASAEEWKIKNFQVVAVEPSGSAEGNNLGKLARLLRNDTFDIDRPNSDFWRVVDSSSLEFDIEEVEKILESSALLMEQAGLPEPSIEPVVKLENGESAYRVYLVTGLGRSAGEYHPEQVCERTMRNESVILLDYNSLFAFGFLDTTSTATIAHELFHAVQFSTPFFRQCEDPQIGSWITEGTARAAGNMIALTLRGSTEETMASAGLYPDMERFWGMRDYSLTLPVPFDPGLSNQSAEAYATGSFWMYLGQLEAMNGKPATPGLNPYSLKFFSNFFTQPAGARDCGSAEAKCRAELAWLDAQIERHFRLKTREAYTRFMQAFVLYGRYRPEARALYDPRWTEKAFSNLNGCRTVELSATGPDMQKRLLMADLFSLSAQCFEIKLDGFGDSDSAPIAVTVEMPSGAGTPRLDSLNTAVADGSERWSKASSQTAATGRQEARWVYDIKTEREFDRGQLVLITNADDRGADTPDFLIDNGTGLAVTFTVQKEYITIRGQGAPGGPSGADINSPFALSGKARAQYWGPFPSRVARGMGLNSPCTFTFSLVDADETSGINISLIQDGPLQTGEYVVAAYDPKEIDSQQDKISKFAGQMVVDFTLGEEHPLIGDYGMIYNGRGGAVRVDSISTEWITGSARIAGRWSEIRPNHLPHNAPAAGPRDLEIVVDFSVANKPILSSLDIGSCVASPN